jgi:hypothetical protein
MKITKQNRNLLIIFSSLAVGGSAAAIIINRGRKSTVLSAINAKLGQAEGGDALAQTATDLKNSTTKASYADSQYSIWAASLFSCFDGWGTCTSYLDIFKKLKNDTDVLKLVTAFGIKTISSGKGNPSPNFTGTLPGAVNDELDATQIAEINQVLSDNGISYSF